MGKLVDWQPTSLDYQPTSHNQQSGNMFMRGACSGNTVHKVFIENIQNCFSASASSLFLGLPLNVMNMTFHSLFIPTLKLCQNY